MCAHGDSEWMSARAQGLAPRTPQTSLLWLCSGGVWGRDEDLLKLQTMCISVCVQVSVCFVLVCAFNLLQRLDLYITQSA